MPANDQRQDYVRAAVERTAAGLMATPFAMQDSSMLKTLADASGLIVREPFAPAADAGDAVPRAAVTLNKSSTNSLKFKQLRNTTGTDSVCSGFVCIRFLGGTPMLTRKQHELLLFIHERLKEAGIPPSFDEMKDALDLASKSGIHRLITALEERGFIRRLPNRARALEVLRLPDSIAPGLNAARKFSPSVIQGSLGRAQPKRRAGARPAMTTTRRAVSVPVMGRIAAGVPIDAIQHKTHAIMVPPEMISGGEHYALEVKGDSMIEAGIFDGDTVIIQQCQHGQSRRDRRGAGRRGGSDAEALSPQGRLDRARSGQSGL